MWMLRACSDRYFCFRITEKKRKTRINTDCIINILLFFVKYLAILLNILLFCAVVFFTNIIHYHDEYPHSAA
jgi:hypothetical protein